MTGLVPLLTDPLVYCTHSRAWLARQAARYADEVRALARARVVAATGGGSVAGAEREQELEEAVLRLQGAVTAPPAERCE